MLSVLAKLVEGGCLLWEAQVEVDASSIIIMSLSLISSTSIRDIDNPVEGLLGLEWSFKIRKFKLNDEIKLYIIILKWKL